MNEISEKRRSQKIFTWSSVSFRNLLSHLWMAICLLSSHILRETPPNRTSITPRYLTLRCFNHTLHTRNSQAVCHRHSMSPRLLVHRYSHLRSYFLPPSEQHRLLQPGYPHHPFQNDLHYAPITSSSPPYHPTPPHAALSQYAPMYPAPTHPFVYPQ